MKTQVRDFAVKMERNQPNWVTSVGCTKTFKDLLKVRGCFVFAWFGLVYFWFVSFFPEPKGCGNRK